MSPRGMAVSNTRYLSSNETRVNAGIRWWKLHLSESTSWQESVGGICFAYISEEQLLYSPWHFQTTAKIQYIQMHLLAQRFVVFFFFFLSAHRSFLKEGVKTYRMRQCRLSTRQLFLLSAHLSYLSLYFFTSFNCFMYYTYWATQFFKVLSKRTLSSL